MAKKQRSQSNQFVKKLKVGDRIVEGRLFGSKGTPNTLLNVIYWPKSKSLPAGQLEIWTERGGSFILNQDPDVKEFFSFIKKLSKLHNKKITLEDLKDEQKAG